MEDSVFFSDLFIIFLGWPATFILGILFSFFHKYYTKKKLNILNSNLKKVNLKWSDKLSKPISIVNFENQKDLDSQSIKRESHSISNYFIILGFLLAFLSWIGFVFSFLLMSYITFSTNPDEKKYFNTELFSNKNLKVEEVNIQINEIEFKC